MQNKLHLIYFGDQNKHLVILPSLGIIEHIICGSNHSNIPHIHGFSESSMTVYYDYIKYMLAHETPESPCVTHMSKINISNVNNHDLNIKNTIKSDSVTDLLPQL